MPRGKILFSQIMSFLPLPEFHRIVQRYQGNHKIQDFTCLDHFRALAFSHLTFRRSLRDIEETLRANARSLYHMGFRCSTISRNTLAHANAIRPWQIYAEYALVLIQEARELYAGEDFAKDLDTTVFALDSATIDLCLSHYPRATFHAAKKTSSTRKLPRQPPEENPSELLRIFKGKTQDIRKLEEVCWEPEALYVLDQDHLDFRRLRHLHDARAYFVTRTKKKLHFAVAASRPFAPEKGIQDDQVIHLKKPRAFARVPEGLRRIRFADPGSGKRVVCLSNHHSLSPETIATLDKQRCQVELFLKWLQQYLRIDYFYGTSDNAVRIQIWVAVSVYVLLAIIRKKLGIQHDLPGILEHLSASIFEERPLQSFFQETPPQPTLPPSNQLILFKLDLDNNDQWSVFFWAVS